jgi:hypothetical protein
LALCPFVLLGLFQGWQEWSRASRPPAEEIVTPLSIKTEVLPAKLAGWQRIGKVVLKTREDGPRFGNFSHVWTFRRGKVRAFLSLDYAYQGWHDLSLCYTSSGWEVKEHETCPPTSQAPACTELLLKKPLAVYGYLRFAALDSQGRWLEDPTPTHLQEALYRRLLHREAPATVYQVQLLLESPLPLEAAEQQFVRQLFDQALPYLERELIRQGKVKRQ